MIKANGDSLRQLTTLNVAHDRQMGRLRALIFIFCRTRILTVPAKLVRADKNGGEVFSFTAWVAPLFAVLRKQRQGGTARSTAPPM
jgi:hypothetical protein